MEMGRALNAEGHNARLVTSNADGARELNRPLKRWVDNEGVQTLFFERAYGEGFKYAKGMFTWLKRHIGEYDIVHIHAVFSWSSLAAGRACRLAGVPYIVRPLGSLDPWSMAQKPFRKKILWRVGVERLLRGAATIHYTTALEQRCAESSLGLGLGNGVVIPNALTLSEYRDDLTDAAFRKTFSELEEGGYILFLGRLHPKKKLEVLIQQFARMHNHPALKLVIAGTGDQEYSQVLTKQAENSAARDKIVFMGWVTGTVKAALLKRCALLVLNSENENYGISVVEAMACARPVVVNQGVYLYHEIENADAGWVASKDEDIAKLLDAALADRKTLACKGRNARALVADKFTWEIVVRQLIDLYRNITGDNGND